MSVMHTLILMIIAFPYLVISILMGRALYDMFKERRWRSK